MSLSLRLRLSLHLCLRLHLRLCLCLCLHVCVRVLQDLLRKGYANRNQYNTTLLQRSADGNVRLAPMRNEGHAMVAKVRVRVCVWCVYTPVCAYTFVCLYMCILVRHENNAMVAKVCVRVCACACILGIGCVYTPVWVYMCV